MRACMCACRARSILAQPIQAHNGDKVYGVMVAVNKREQAGESDIFFEPFFTDPDWCAPCRAHRMHACVCCKQHRTRLPSSLLQLHMCVRRMCRAVCWQLHGGQAGAWRRPVRLHAHARARACSRPLKAARSAAAATRWPSLRTSWAT